MQVNLGNPKRSERIRAGFQPHWRTVFVYECPNCKKEIRIFANSFIGKHPTPGVGAIICDCTTLAHNAV